MEYDALERERGVILICITKRFTLKPTNFSGLCLNQ